MRWAVETLDQRVDREIAELPDSLRARIVRLMELVELKGPQALHAPHARHLDGPLWELRAKAEEGIARGIYVAVTGQRVIILHVFVKKSEKTPRRALSLALDRLKVIK